MKILSGFLIFVLLVTSACLSGPAISPVKSMPFTNSYSATNNSTDLLQPPEQLNFDSVEDYAKSIGVSNDYLPMLQPLGKMDDIKKAYVDALRTNDQSALEGYYDITFTLFSYFMTDIDRSNAEFGAELRKIPDSKEIASGREITVKDVKSVENMSRMVKEGKFVSRYFTTTVDEILDLGIKDKRQYDSAVEALYYAYLFHSPEYFQNEWVIPDLDRTLPSWCNSSSNAAKLCAVAWGEGRESNISTYPVFYSYLKEFQGQDRPKRWRNWDEAVARLNDPYVIPFFPLGSLGGPRNGFSQIYAENTFKNPWNVVCADVANFYAYLLSRNGWDSHILGVSGGAFGHAVAYYINPKDEKIYYLEECKQPYGPFDTIEDVAKKVSSEKGVGSSFIIFEPK